MSPACSVIRHLPQWLFIPSSSSATGWGRFARCRGHRSITFVKPSYKPKCCQLLQNWLQGVEPISSCMTHTPYSVQYLETLTPACCWRKKKRSPNQYLPLAGMCIGTEWGKNKSFEHNMQACVQICFMAELELFLIVNMSRSFVPPTQKCVLLGVRFYSWPS